MYMALHDTRMIRREPVRVINLDRGMGHCGGDCGCGDCGGELAGLGFAPAGILAVSAGAGPVGWIVAGVASVIPLIKGLFTRGHKDDAIDASEHTIVKQVFAPMLSEVLGRSVRGIWNENSKGVCPKEGCGHDIEAASYEAQMMEERGEWRLSAQRTAEWIQYGDQIIQEACATFAAQGFPCHKWTSGSGGGTYAYEIWQVLRQVMMAGLGVAQQREAEAAAPPAPQTTANPQTTTAPAASGAGTGSGAAPGAAAVPGSLMDWFSRDTDIGGQKIPNMLLAAGAGVAIAVAVSK